MAISKDNDRLTIIISKDSKDKLAELAKEDGRSLSSYITNILQEHLDEVNKNKPNPMWELKGSEPLKGEQQSMLSNKLDPILIDEIEMALHKEMKLRIEDMVFKKFNEIFSDTSSVNAEITLKKPNNKK